jgi:hypothetical protein
MGLTAMRAKSRRKYEISKEPAAVTGTSRHSVCME